MGGVSSGHLEEKRARNLERARRIGVPDSVAQLFAIVQEPRSDDEPSTPAFDAVLRDETTRLRERINAPVSDSGMLFDPDGIGGLLESEATTSARRLLTVAVSNDMPMAADLLRAALERCRSISQRGGVVDVPVLPKPELIVNPETGRPIGMWR